MKTGSVLSNIFKKAGIDITDAKFAEILAIGTEIPDETATAIETTLMSLEAAKNNPTLKSHYFAQALNGTDSEIERIMTEIGLEDVDKATLKAETSTMKRVGLLTNKVKELEAKKAGAEKSVDKKAINEEINGLNTKIKDLEKISDQRVNEATSKGNQKLLGALLKTQYSAINYANKELPNVDLMDLKTKEALVRDGAIIILDEKDEPTLKRASDPTLDWHTTANEKVSVADYIKGIAASNKLIAVSNGGAAAGADGKQKTPVIISGGGQPNTSSFAAANEALLAEVAG